MDVSAEKVESIDQLLMEILIRLPSKSMFKFRCVSKRWKNITCDSFFIRSFNERWLLGRGGGRLLCFIQGTLDYINPHVNPRPKSLPLMNMLPSAGIPNNRVMKSIPRKLGYFIHSSDGLILCGRHPKTYNVLNPITEKWVPLPPPPPPPYYKCCCISIGLTCDEIEMNSTGKMVANYRVVRACIPYITYPQGNTLPIQTYTSKTGEWVESILVGTESFTLYDYWVPEVLNGVFHWCVAAYSMAVYDPNDVDSEGESHHLQFIKIPDQDMNFVITRSSEDVLWFGYRNTADRLEFWMLPKGENGSYKRSTTIPVSEWILMHTIDDISLYNDCGLSPVIYYHDGELELFNLEFLIPWNPIVAVLRLDGSIFLYNLKTKSMDLVEYHGSFIEDDDLLDPYLDSPFLSAIDL